MIYKISVLKLISILLVVFIQSSYLAAQTDEFPDSIQAIIAEISEAKITAENNGRLIQKLYKNKRYEFNKFKEAFDLKENKTQDEIENFKRAGEEFTAFEKEYFKAAYLYGVASGKFNAWASMVRFAIIEKGLKKTEKIIQGEEYRTQAKEAEEAYFAYDEQVKKLLEIKISGIGGMMPLIDTGVDIVTKIFNWWSDYKIKRREQRRKSAEDFYDSVAWTSYWDELLKDRDTQNA